MSATAAVNVNAPAIPREEDDSSAKQEEIDINLEDPQVKEAAKKIQNVFRVKRVADKKAAETMKNGSTQE